MDQVVPSWAGRQTLYDGDWSSAVWSLDMVMVNPMVSPAETGELSATLAMSMAAPRTTMRSEERRVGKEGVVTLAVLSTGEITAVPEVVGEEMCTVSNAREAMSPKEQDRTPAEMEHRA